MTTVTRLYLIRHGATVLTAEDRFAGATNVALSNEGRRQASALAVRLKGVKFSAIYASPLDRTMETASILAQPHQLEVQARDGLREISHGRWEGMTREEVLTAYPDEVAAWDEDPYTFAPVGGESGLAVTARALPPLMEICSAHRGEHVAIVSHKATIRLLTLAAALASPWQPSHHTQRFGSDAGSSPGIARRLPWATTVAEK